MLGPANSGSLAASSEEQQPIRNKNNNKNEKPFEGSFGSPQCFPAFVNFPFPRFPVYSDDVLSLVLRPGCVGVRGWEA